MEKMNFVPLEIQPLLNEFKEIVVDDLPTGLPWMIYQQVYRL